MITLRYGDVLEQGADIVCQQVNCRGAMGTGLAKQVMPLLSKDDISAYIRACLKYRAALLGRVQFAKTRKGVIANCFAQDGYGHDKCYTDYSALKMCLEKVRTAAENTGCSCVAIPYKIGCGNAGGDWETVKQIIDSVFDRSNLEIMIVSKENEMAEEDRENISECTLEWA